MVDNKKLDVIKLEIKQAIMSVLDSHEMQGQVMKDYGWGDSVNFNLELTVQLKTYEVNAIELENHEHKRTAKTGKKA